MDKKTTGIILTVIAVLCCGCPGLSSCLGGILTVAGLGTYEMQLPGMETSGPIPPLYGVGGICSGLILILIPILVAFFTLRSKPQASVGELPPAS
jgi:hypothetical protein